MKKFMKVFPAFAVAVVAGVVGHTMITAQAGESKTIPETVYIEDMNVSGMTREEAEKELDSYVSRLGSTTFTLTTGDTSIRVSAQDLGIKVENEEVVDEALNIGKTGNLITRYKDKKDLENEPRVFNLIFSADENRVETILGANRENLDQEAVNCGLTRENGRFQIIDGADGIEVNVADSVANITKFISEEWDGESASIELATDVTKPQGSREEMEKVKDVLGTFHTDFSSSSAGRATNVKNGCSKIDGTVLFPGEQFSVAEALNPMTAENGYELAGSYENGTTVQTYGGGICQVSTTLYNAVILSELQVDERYNHSMIVNYVEPSMDAAIAGTSKDFKFSNNTDAPIYIEGYTENGQIYFTVFGEETRPSNRVVTYESETLSETPPGVTIQANGGYPIGYVAQSGSPHTGYTAKLWKVVTVNGVEQSRTEFNQSRYNPSNKILVVGVGTDNPEAAAQINAAIATGDEGTVRATAAGLAANPPQQEQAPPPEEPEEEPAAAVIRDDDRGDKDEKEKDDGGGDEKDEGDGGDEED